MNEKLPFRFQIHIGKESDPLFLTILDICKRLSDGRLHQQYRFTSDKSKATYLNLAAANYWMKRLEGYPIRLIEITPTTPFS